MKRLHLVVMLLLCSIPTLAKDPEPYFQTAPMPFYPPLARQARIEGTVKLRFVVTQDGATDRVEALSGHALLRAAAIDNVKQWKFGWPNPCICTTTKEAELTYKLTGKEENSDSAIVVRWFRYKSRVEIETDLPQINIVKAY